MRAEPVAMYKIKPKPKCSAMDLPPQMRVLVPLNMHHFLFPGWYGSSYGDPALLKRHTVYSPIAFTPQSTYKHT